MSPPSYAHRHTLCSELLASLPDPPDYTPFQLGTQPESSKAAQLRSRKIDHLLLQSWAGKGRQTEAEETLQRVESLRIKRADFEVLGRVGDGQFGAVDAVRCRFDGKVYAMKTMEKFKAQRAGAQLSLPCERHLHLLGASTNSSHVPKLIAAFQTPSSIMMVTEFAPCGTLWDRLVSSTAGRLEEREARWWTSQIADAVQWCHQQGFAHRDVKPHNLLLNPNGRLWLTDFGSAAPLLPTRGQHLHPSACLLPCGTADYIAPEVLAYAERAFMDALDPLHAGTGPGGSEAGKGYSASCDWWSLGAVVYELVHGVAPFFADKVEHTYQRIMRCGETLVFDKSFVSSDLEGFVRRLLCEDTTRLEYTSIKRHAWLQHPDLKLNANASTPPPWLAPLASVDLDVLTQTYDATAASEEDGFDKFFMSSPGLSSMSVSTQTRTYASISIPTPAPQEQQAWYRWLGWTYEPSPSSTVFDSASDVGAASRPRTLPLPTPKPTHRLTPAPAPAPDPRSFKRLVDCVQDSARKKFVAMSAKRSAAAGATALRWEPPTPSPMPRPGSDLARSGSGLTLAAEPRKTMPSQGQDQGKQRQQGLDALMERHRGLNRQLDTLESQLQSIKANAAVASPR